MIYGIIRLINFAHGDVFMIGSFMGFTVLTSLASPHNLLGVLVGGAPVAGEMGFRPVGVGVGRETPPPHPLPIPPPFSTLTRPGGPPPPRGGAPRLIFGSGFSSYPDV